MKLQHLERFYLGMLLLVFGGIVVHAPLSVWLGTVAPGAELLIKSWKEIIMLLAIPVAAVLVTKRGLWTEFSRDWLFRLIIAFALIHVIMGIVFWNGLTATFAGFTIDLRWLLYFSLAYTLLRIQPRYRALFIRIGTIGALIVGVFAVLQVTVLPRDILSSIGYNKDTTIAPYLTVDQNEDYVRINSTLRGPNPLGAYAVMVLSLLFAFILSSKNRSKPWILGILTISSVVALWFSYSRSAFLALGLAGAIIAYMILRARLSKKVWIIGAATLGVVVALVAALWQTQFVQQVILHEDPTEGNSVNSNDGHLESLQTGMQRLIEQPFGAGVGSTGSASLYGDTDFIIENQYLFIAHEAGWLGLLLFILLFGLVMYRLLVRRSDWLALGVFASGVGLAVIGILLPVWVDDTVAIIWWGFAAVVLGGTYGKKRTSN